MVLILKVMVQGMFNPIVNPAQYPGVPTESDGEMIDAFEIGTKNILLDGTLLANYLLSITNMMECKQQKLPIVQLLM